jgi:hypothetical protein
MFNSMLPLNKLLLNDLPIVPLVYKAGWLAGWLAGWHCMACTYNICNSPRAEISGRYDVKELWRKSLRTGHSSYNVSNNKQESQHCSCHSLTYSLVNPVSCATTADRVPLKLLFASSLSMCMCVREYYIYTLTTSSFHATYSV